MEIAFIYPMHFTNLFPHFHSCFISMWPQVGGLLVPIGIILVVNTVIFIRVIRRLGRTVKGRAVDKTEKRQRLRRLQNAVMIMILMGLTWAVGYLSLIWPGSAVVQGIFAVLNSFQGYFIFMLYCVRQPLVRKIWRDQFNCCLTKAMRSPSSRDTSSETDKTNPARLKAKKDGNSSGLDSGLFSEGFKPESISTSPPQRLTRPLYPGQ